MMVLQVKVDMIEVHSFRQEENEPPVYDVTVVLHVTSDFGRHEFRIPVNGASTLENAVSSARDLLAQWAKELMQSAD
jgi:hypothetical protein